VGVEKTNRSFGVQNVDSVNLGAEKRVLRIFSFKDVVIERMFFVGGDPD